MGEAATYLMGGSQSKSEAGNKSYGYLQNALGGTISQGGQAGSAIANLLGLNGGPAQNEGFNNFRNSTGYQFGLNQGMQAITGGAASKGLLNSGGALKALQGYGQDYANSKFGDYMSLLGNQQTAGLQGAGVLSSAGDWSKSKAIESKGAGGFIGSLMGK
jgi:hypothetical protein